VVELLSSGLMFLGGLIALTGGTLAWVPWIRYLRAPALPDRKGRSIAMLQAMYLVLLAAAIGAAGMACILIGGAISYGIPWWGPTLPLALLAGCLGVAIYTRHLATQQQDPH
jgi:hypothetical protein